MSVACGSAHTYHVRKIQAEVPRRHATASTAATPMTSEQIIQNAYHVPDLGAGIARFHALWGVGPFFEGRGATYLDTFELLGHDTEI